MRLIDADALIEYFSLRLDDEHYVERTFKEVAGEDIIPIINIAPTIEIESVKRGNWTRKDDRDTYGLGAVYWYECSNCGGIAYYECSYCPNCGARMDVEEGEGK